MQQVRETGTRPNMGGRVAVFVSFPVWRPRARIPRANQPIWPRMHSLIPAGFSDTCQRAIFSLSQWERQEPGSNPQLKRLEQNNSAGDHRPWACVFALLCSVSVCAQIVNRVFDWVVVVVLVELVYVCVFLFLWASGTCRSVTAPETSCMRAANIKRFAGRTAVGCIAGKQKSPGFSPLGLLGKRLVNKNRVRSGIYVQQNV